MNRGPEKKSSSEMMTDPEQLKGWINLLNSSSSDIKPLVAIIVTKDETKHIYNLPEDMHELIKFLEFVQSSDRMPEKALPKEHNDSPYPSEEEKHEGEETNHHEEGGTESMKT